MHNEEIKSLSIDADKVDNAVLKRLIEEVRYEKENNIGAYNRLHNRHNRSRGGDTYPQPKPQEPKPEEPDEKQ